MVPEEYQKTNTTQTREGRKLRVAIHTLGCKLNYAESSHIVRQFAQGGHEVVDYNEVADLYIINTCTVTAIAEKKCRTAVRQAIRLNNNAQVAVMGCFAQNEPNAIASIPGVSYVLGNNDKMKLYDIIASTQETPVKPCIYRQDVPEYFAPAFSSGDRTRSFFKVQDGCDYFCTYCAIPFARGRSRSATIADTIATARQLAQTGVKEVVLTGVNTGTFGKQHNENFVDLLKALDEIEEIKRYRISSIEPNLITNEIIDYVASSRAFLPHFHIPLQAGSDKVLKLMHRHYDTALYAEKLHYIKTVMPDACIAADIMAGFYGEDEETFDKSCLYIEQLPISYLHVFTYSERPNTAALRMTGRVPMEIRRQRSHTLQQLSMQKKQQFYQQHIGEIRPVLWEDAEKDGKMFGFTDNYIRIAAKYDATLTNTIQPIEVNGQNIVTDFDE